MSNALAALFDDSDPELETFAEHLSAFSLDGNGASPSLATAAIHADHEASLGLPDIAPAFRPSTNYRYREQMSPVLDDEILPNTDLVYARVCHAGSNRYEQVLSNVLKPRNGKTAQDSQCYAVSYTSGVAAFNGLLNTVLPGIVIMPEGSYHGLHGALNVHQKVSRGAVSKIILKRPFDRPESWAAVGEELKKIKETKPDVGPTIIHIETPINPTGEAVDLRFIAERAKEHFAITVVDSTIGPPPLQNCFDFGIDIILHSGSKYFGGHSDMLCGILATRNKTLYRRLISDRLVLGNTLGSMETWLGLRSIRTLNMRVRQQSSNAEKIVNWLNQELDAGSEVIRACVAKVQHTSSQKRYGNPEETAWIDKQMPGGGPALFSITMKSEEIATKFPEKLRLFSHATSLGGVESLVERRRITDKDAPPELVRVSIGIEDWEELQADFLQAFEKIYASQKV